MIMCSGPGLVRYQCWLVAWPIRCDVSVWLGKLGVIAGGPTAFGTKACYEFRDVRVISGGLGPFKGIKQAPGYLVMC